MIYHKVSKNRQLGTILQEYQAHQKQIETPTKVRHQHSIFRPATNVKTPA